VSAEAPLFVRLYLDEDVHRRVASALRLRHFDVVSAHEVRRWGLTDDQQLSYAAMEGRALFTYNAADYLQLHLNWLRSGREHRGIIISDQLPIDETVRRLLSLLNRVAADEMCNELRWLQAFK
jgi:hypothetical protein